MKAAKGFRKPIIVKQQNATQLMPTVTVVLEDGNQRFDVQEGVRLVLALKNNDIDISHRCGGFAKCTTCRCEISQGAPEQMTQAESDRLANEDGQFRLSCQVPVNQDMTVKPLMRVKDMDWDDAGKRPEELITPEPSWIISDRQNDLTYQN